MMSALPLALARLRIFFLVFKHEFIWCVDDFTRITASQMMASQSERQTEREREREWAESKILSRIVIKSYYKPCLWRHEFHFALGRCRDGSTSSLEAVVTRSVCLRYASVSIVRGYRLSWWNVYGRSVFIGLLDHRRRSVSFCDRRTQTLADDAMVCYVMGAACGCHTLSVVLI